MDLVKETRDRIFSAADSLYEQAGRAAFPTVDAVRKLAKVNMNDASAGMKEWRRTQTAQAAPVAVLVPEAVQQASSAALVALWQGAQDLANESLRAAQAGWDSERAEADTLTKQMADAYEALATELEAAQVEIAQLKASGLQVAAELVRLADELESTRRERLAAQAATERAEARSVEIERRATDLRTELDHAHRDAEQARTAAMVTVAERDQVRAELVKMKATTETQDLAHQAQRKKAAEDLAHQANRYTTAQAERDEAKKAAAAAREHAAELTGKLGAIESQNAALLERLAPTNTR